MIQKLFIIFNLFTTTVLFAPNADSASISYKVKSETEKLEAPEHSIESINFLYDSFSENNLDMPSLKSFQEGILGYQKLEESGEVKNNILSIVDFSLSSTKKRLWILDMDSQKVLFNTYVAHGQGSGGEMATHFSNQENSHQSSLGFFITGETYYGKNGLSLFIDGMEKGVNDNARERYVVIHGSKYVTSDFIKRAGRLGRSYGCPAVPKKLSIEIIEAIKGESVLFIYYPDEKYAENSVFLQNGTV